MANKNTNPASGKTAVPADINNAQPACFPKPHHTWEGQRPRCPHPQPKTSQNAKTQLFAKIAQYRNQISRSQGVAQKFLIYACLARYGYLTINLNPFWQIK